MFGVKRDSNCFEPEEFPDDNPRVSGVYELMQIFIWPAIGSVLLFAAILFNNYGSLERQKNIYKRFYTSSVQPWHMHRELKIMLERLRMSERYRRREFAELARDSNGVAKIMEAQMDKAIEKIDEKQMKLMEEIRKTRTMAELMYKEEQIIRKHRLNQQVELLQKEFNALEQQRKKIEQQYESGRRHKYSTLFDKQKAGNVLWSPLDQVLNHVKNKYKMIAVSSAWQTFRRGFPIYAWPILAATMIFVDWNHTREWKAAGRVSALEKEILGRQ
uniref:Golgin subfamily A member 6-like protein 22 n=1 Tax=Caenorhabditis tropicalis TaxID=1561998 RepID=A0A1I7UD85_9PELO